MSGGHSRRRTGAQDARAPRREREITFCINITLSNNMNLIRPFAGLRPAPGRAADVMAPPYDVLNADEARVRAAGKPWSFLHISKPEIDLPVGTDPYSAGVYAKGRENFLKMREQG